MANAASSIWNHAASHPEKPAVRHGGATWTYGQLRDQSAGWAYAFRAAGIGVGERVLLVAGTCAEYVPAYHGILAAGGVAVTVNSMSTGVELQYFLEDSGASLVVAAEDCLVAARKAVDATDADVNLWSLEAADVTSVADPSEPQAVANGAGAVIMYTSGTTGRPKGAHLTHGNIIGSAESLIEALEIGAQDRWASALPLFHVFGQVTVMRTTLHAGATMHLLPKFDAAALLRLCAERRITILSGVPTMWNAMVNVDAELGKTDFAALRTAVSGGASLPGEVSRGFEERFGCELLPGYGLTETAGAGCCHRRGWPRREGSVGIPWPGVEMRVLGQDRREVPRGKIGEVAIKSLTTMPGYWRRPDATAEVFVDDWFLTGDLGRMDADDHVWIVDRKKDLVIRGGYNVYPREIEEVLYGHPDILEAAVVGLPDEYLGEEIAAVVALRPGRTFDADAMRFWMGERLAAYKTPRIYQVVDELPKGATGKILKRGIDREAIRTAGVHLARRDTVETTPRS